MKKILLILLITIMFIPVNVSFAAITPSSFKPANISVRDDGTYYSYTDSSKTVHEISYAQIDNSKKGLRLLFSYIDDSVKFNETTKPNPNKDGCLKIEHFENVSGKMVSKTTEKINIKEMQLALNEIIIDKSYADDQYIYFKLSFMKDTSSKTENKTFYFKISNPFYITSVKLPANDIYLLPGQTYTGKISCVPSNAEPITVRAYCNNKEIADVEYDDDGNFTVKGLKTGNTKLTYVTYSNVTTTCNIIVVNPDFPFIDVSSSAWYYNSVKEAFKLGLMTGATDTLFKPTANMNRGMVAIVFHRMEGAPDVAYSTIFKDVYDKQYFTTAVMWAKQTGIINGYNNGTFMPLKNVTREEMATMIQRFAKYKGLDVSSTKDITYFEDYNQITAYALEPLQWCVENGLISGKFNGTKVDPLGTATRAECAKMLAQAYKVIYEN